MKIEKDEVINKELAKALRESLYLVNKLIEVNQTLVKYGIDMNDFISNLGGNELSETDYLLSSENNKKHLDDSIKQAKK
jgi:hypothetical protein